MSIRITAAIPTFNRLPYLRTAMESLYNQSLAPDSYEILVVDNMSTDGTAEFVKGEASRVSNLTYLAETTPGTSCAKNAAVKQARGAFIAFLDDDAVAEPNWLERILHAFESNDPQPGQLGGRTEPIWEADRPRWLSDECLGALSIVDWLREPGYLSDGQYLVAANIAYRSELLRSIGGFPEHLGRIGTSLRSGEETYVQSRLEEMGYPAYFDPSIVVGHCVQQNRVDRDWFLQRAFWQGLSDGSAEPVASQRAARRTRRIFKLIWRLLVFPFRLIPPLLRNDPATRFDHRCSAMRAVGELSARSNQRWVFRRYREDVQVL